MQYQSLDDFINKWNSADKKQAISKEMDIFDFICHTALNLPPLTRSERVNNVKKRDYFTQDGEQVRKVLESLLEKYADEGIENIEILKY